ncbi:MAG: allophanate hydrolase subunit 1 [Gemmataceae bacterium]
MDATLISSITPLGDQAALVSCPNEEAALTVTQAIRTLGVSWLIDVVQAYTTVAVYFDLGQIRFADVSTTLANIQPAKQSTQPRRSHIIPCCYDFELDLKRVCDHTGLNTEDVIRLHTGCEYTVYAIGFCPGFPYLGYLPAELTGLPRLERPRVRVEAGTVGLTGRQTGIYTLDRPGGWNLIGKTPLELVNVADEYFPLRVGDRVRFQRIDEAEFAKLKGERLLVVD